MFHKPVCYFLNKKPNSKLSIDLPTFLSTPETEVGIPVSREKLCLAELIPKALFQEKEKPYLPILLFLSYTNHQLQLEVLIVDSNLFSLSSERPLKKSIPVRDSI